MKQPSPKPQPTIQVRPGQVSGGTTAAPQVKPQHPPQKQHPALVSATRPETVAPARPQAARSTAVEFRGSPERLILVLEKSRQLYQQLLGHSKERRAALRAGDYAGFSKIDEPERRIVAQIEELDQLRLGEAKALATRLGLPPDASLVEIGEKLPRESGTRVIALREELRTLVLEVRRESSVVRQAAERLSAHIAGIVQSVHSVLAHANIYSSGGQIATVGGGVISSLDIRS
ncbi:MAG: hypothetical protein RLY21_1129 [Planctomycetota bacterium]